MIKFTVSKLSFVEMIQNSAEDTQSKLQYKAYKLLRCEDIFDLSTCDLVYRAVV